MNNFKENLFIVAVEECAELEKEICKALRFGMSGVSVDSCRKNSESIIHEFFHVKAMMEMLEEEGCLPSIKNIIPQEDMDSFFEGLVRAEIGVSKVGLKEFLLVCLNEISGSYNKLKGNLIVAIKYADVLKYSDGSFNTLAVQIVMGVHKLEYLLKELVKAEHIEKSYFNKEEKVIWEKKEKVRYYYEKGLNRL